MTRTLRVAAFIAGGALFLFLIADIGPRQLVADARAAGWIVIPILLLWAVVYLLNAAAWRCTMACEARRPPFAATWAMTASGFALNFVTPVVNLGGEPYKAVALAAWLPRRRAATSVIIHKLLHTLGHLLFWLTALAIALVSYARSGLDALVLITAIAGVAGLAGLVWVVHRHGGLELAIRLLRPVPVLRRVALALDARRGTIAEMDRQIVEFYRASPRRFLRALGCEYGSRLVGALEYYFIFLSLGLQAGYVPALLVSGLLSLAINLTFFVPFEVGTKEAATYLLFARLGLDPHLGVFAAFVTRLRDLLWIAAGLALLWVAGPRPAPAPVEPVA